MKLTGSVYLIRGTSEQSAEERLDALPDELAGVSLSDLEPFELTEEDAIMLRSPGGMDAETKIAVERKIADILGDPVRDEENEDETEEE